MKTKIRLISDLQLMIMAILGFIIMSIACGIGIWLVRGMAPDEVVPTQIFFAGLLLAFYLALFYAISQNICLLTLSEDSVSITRLFRKTVSIPYKHFGYLYHGCYFHGNIFGQGLWMHYIVFSQERLPADVLSHVNQLINSEVTFRIRFTKRSYQKLCAILPQSYRRKLDSILTRAGLL